MSERTRAERTNRAGGFIGLAGAVTSAVGAFQPWTVVQGPHVSISLYRIVEFTPNTTASVAGGNDSVPIAAAAVFGGLAALILLAVRSRGLFSRLLLLLAGAATGLFGGYLIWYANNENHLHVAGNDRAVRGFFNNLLNGVAHQIVQVKPGTGAYMLAAGGGAMALAAFMPGRKVPTHTTIVFPAQAHHSGGGGVVFSPDGQWWWNGRQWLPSTVPAVARRH